MYCSWLQCNPPWISLKGVSESRTKRSARAIVHDPRHGLSPSKFVVLRATTRIAIIGGKASWYANLPCSLVCQDLAWCERPGLTYFDCEVCLCLYGYLTVFESGLSWAPAWTVMTALHASAPIPRSRNIETSAFPRLLCTGEHEINIKCYI
jgi:hypothetical protein